MAFIEMLADRLRNISRRLAQLLEGPGRRVNLLWRRDLCVRDDRDNEQRIQDHSADAHYARHSRRPAKWTDAVHH